MFVVDYDGQNPAKLVMGELAPPLGNAIHYESFLTRICELYRRQFVAKV